MTDIKTEYLSGFEQGNSKHAELSKNVDDAKQSHRSLRENTCTNYHNQKNRYYNLQEINTVPVRWMYVCCFLQTLWTEDFA